MAISTGAHSRNLPTSLQICKGRAEHSTSKTQKIVMSRRSLEMLVVQRFIITTFWLWNLIILDPTRTYKDSIEICGNWSWGASFTSKKQLPFSIWSEFSLAGWLPALMKALLRWWRSLSCIFMHRAWAFIFSVRNLLRPPNSLKQLQNNSESLAV